MNLPNDVARCDGLLPKLTQLDGKPMVLWSIDCPVREQCARFCQMERDSEDVEQYTSYVSHQHAPGDPCPDFMPETTDESP